MNRGKKRTVITLLILAMAVCALLAACGEDEESTVQQNTEPTKKIVTAREASEKNASGVEQDAAVQEEATQEEHPQTADSSGDDSGQAADEQNAGQPDAAMQGGAPSADSGGSSSNGKTKTGSGKTAPKAKYCSVSVDNYCSGEKIKISSKDTAYSVLKKTGAVVSARKTQYGIYVEGINGLFEFDMGDTSGWMYSVNGTAPNKSADKYKVKKGDKVIWYYVTEK